MSRIFRGDETEQRDGVHGGPAVPVLWYWEPDDYEGDVLYSTGYVTREQAESASLGEIVDSDSPEEELGDHMRDVSARKDLGT